MKKIISAFISILIILSTFSCIAFYAKEPLSEVETIKNYNGYYSIEFKINEPDEWVYLTGLSVSQVSYIAQKVADLGPSQTLEDKLFIDAEKLNNDDLNLCWAAATSNILYYTGWSKNDKIDFETVYDYKDTKTGNLIDYNENQALLKYYADNFTNNGGLVSLGVDWFISGRYDVGIYGNPDSFAKPEISSQGGALFPEYSMFTLTNTNSLMSDQENKSSEYFGNLISDIKNSNGASLGINFYEPTDLNTSLGGHAVTFWGYTYNKSMQMTQPGYFTSFIITDSDDSMLYESTALPGQLPNLIARVGVEWDRYFNAYVSKTYSPGYIALFMDYTTLVPRSMIKDTPSTVVTTTKNGIDVTDGEISLLEAMCFSENGLSKTVTFAPEMNGARFDMDYLWFFESDMIIDASATTSEIYINVDLATSGMPAFTVMEGKNVTFRNISIYLTSQSDKPAIGFVNRGNLTLDGCKIGTEKGISGLALYGTAGSYSEIINHCNIYFSNSEKIYLEDGAQIEFKLGDTDKSGKTTLDDAMKVFMHVAGKIILEGSEFTASDIDGDSIITISDAMRIFKLVAGKFPF